MTISTRGRYALSLMIDLAQHNTGEYIALKDVCKRQQISIKYLEQIVSQLGKSGFLKSARGSQGGYQLAKAPEEYTIGSILRQTEGGLAPVSCLKDQPNQCPHYKECLSVPFWEGLYRTINEYMEGVTLADLVEEKKSENPSMPVYFL